MIDVDAWMPEATARLREVFGERLVYLGLQGSYRRGEAREDSDIDLVAVIDPLDVADLDRYRETVHSLPEGHKACGFLSDRATLWHWPRHELFGFRQDTRDYHGALDPLLPPLSRDDVETAVRVGASGLYHLAVHSYLYADTDARPGLLADARKGAYFVLLGVEYLRSGCWAGSRGELLPRLTDGERGVLGEAGASESCRRIVEWCRGVLQGC